jgi:hypothetical protein
VIEAPLLRSIRLGIDVVILVVVLPLIAVFAVTSLMPWWRRRPPQRPRLLWGSQPIKALASMKEAAARAGWDGEVVAREHSRLYRAEVFDHVVLGVSRFRVLDRLADSFKAYWFFARALLRYDVFIYYFDGGVLRRTALERMELPLLKLLRKKLVVVPYGSDSWVLDHTDNLLWRTALLIDYASAGARAREVEAQVRRGCRYADCVLGCLVHIACLPRYDVLPLTCYPIDTEAFEPRPPRTSGPIHVAHSANHRGFKGTDFLVAAVERLRAAGHEIELDVIERVANEEALARVARADVYVDQLVAGYAYAALEAMALGKVVISPISDTDAARVFRRYSYLDECPIVDASVETIEAVLVELIERRDEWPAMGRESREFCERRHSIDANSELWDAILRRVWNGEEIELMKLYHPLLGSS